MATVVEKTIGSTGADYPTVAAWWAAVPANLVTADEVWRGRLQNEEHTTALPWFGGKTTDSTRYAELTAVAGGSWRDMPSQPMRYGYGARVLGAAEYSSMMTGDNAVVLHVRDIQFKNSGNGGILDNSNYNFGGEIEGCLFEGPCSGLTGFLIQSTRGALKNSTLIKTGSSCAGVAFLRTAAYGCTFVNLGGAVTTGVIAIEYSSGIPLVDCGVFGGGATNATGGGGSFAVSNCATDDATPPTGFTTVAFDTATGAKFTNITAGSHDFRIASSSALAAAGVANAQLTLDAYRVTRPNPPSIGAAEPAPGPANLTGNVTLDAAIAAGTLGSSASDLGGNVTLDPAVAAGTLGVQPGTLTTAPWRSPVTGALLASLTIPKISILRISDMTQVLSLTNQTTNGSGVLTITNAALMPAVPYLVIACNADGTAVGAEAYTAT